MNCKNCGKENRPDACFCRFCGEPLIQEQRQDSLIGKDNIIPLLEDFDKKLKIAKVVAQNGTKMGFDCLILGDAGTGKNFVANLLAAKIMASGSKAAQADTISRYRHSLDRGFFAAASTTCPFCAS